MKSLSFPEKCYHILIKVPKGKVTTYKAIAKALNSRAYQAVGTAMKNNPYAPIVPCHRVINSNGDIGNFNKGQKIKIQMLKREGIEIINNNIDLDKYGFKF